MHACLHFNSTLSVILATQIKWPHQLQVRYYIYIYIHICVRVRGCVLSCVKASIHVRLLNYSLFVLMINQVKDATQPPSLLLLPSLLSSLPFPPLSFPPPKTKQLYNFQFNYPKINHFPNRLFSITYIYHSIFFYKK